MRTYGIAAPADSDTCEIRVIGENGVVVVFGDSTIDQLSIPAATGLVPYAELALTLEAAIHVPVVADGSQVEIWSGKSEALRRLFRGSIDYVETSSAEGLTKIVLQARGLAAALLDAPFHGDAGTTLAGVVATIARGVGLASTMKHPDVPMTAWLNAASAYGALRLLAVNFDALVRTDDDIVEFVSSEAFRAKLSLPPTVSLDVRDIKTSHTVHGRPIKK